MAAPDRRLDRCAAPELHSFLHAPVMARLDDVAVASATKAWQQDALPAWAEVRARWRDGRGPGRGLSRPLPPGQVPVAA